MSVWRIEFMPAASADLDHLISDLTYKLQAPQTARKIYHQIRDEVVSLRRFPLRYPLYSEEPWKSRGLRKMVVGNYLVFYIPQKERALISVVRIVYGRRDIQNALSETELPS